MVLSLGEAANLCTLFMQTSIANLQPKSNAMYADWISVWAISLFLYWVSRSHNFPHRVVCDINLSWLQS